jgi:hypothetical protein
MEGDAVESIERRGTEEEWVCSRQPRIPVGAEWVYDRDH